MTTFKREFNFDENIMERISINIRKYRKLAGITQEQLAVDVGRSYDFIRRLEYKKGAIGCSIDTLYKISIVLGVTMDKLFE
ncbi:MAG: helix-turn-helix domain-containing protein [Candidatus Coprovivens sp.]